MRASVFAGWIILGLVLFLCLLPIASAGLGSDHHDDCFSCHDTSAVNNLAFIADVVNTPNSGPREVVFLAREGVKSFADGDDVYDGICEVCHTVAAHHRNNPSGDHVHYAATNCLLCHTAQGGFWWDLPGWDHPQAVTDCGSCHLVGGEPNLPAIHGNNCMACHQDGGFDSTILGPLGAWGGECSECHNPSVSETGFGATPEMGHRCVLCHGEQLPIGPLNQLHYSHAEKASCVVCHGEIPDAAVVVGSGDRSFCELCHQSGQYEEASLRTVHRKHTSKEMSCFECHGNERPAVDVEDGAPVGGAINVCQICHADESPEAFDENSVVLHMKHTDKGLDCSGCHMDAVLQDDRMPMPAIDDPVRASLNRGGYEVCNHCHEGGVSGSVQNVHDGHVGGSNVWCFTCHDAGDGRPLGLTPPIMQAVESCNLCHSGRQYQDSLPFDVHRLHSGDVRCYACHQGNPRLLDWPGW